MALPSIGLAAGARTELGFAPEALAALLLTEWARSAGARGLLYVARSETRATRMAEAARGFAPDIETLMLPPWDCLPYDRVSPSRRVMGQRIAALRHAARRGGRPKLLLTTVEAMLQRAPAAAAFDAATVTLAAGEPFDADQFSTSLLRAGYFSDERVDEPGEAAIRGAVVDIFVAESATPYRLDVSDGRLQSIRRFEPGTQRTIEEVDRVTIAPVSEVLLAPGEVQAFMLGEDAGEAAGEEQRTDPAEAAALAEAARAGIEHWLPLFHERLETLFDLLPQAALVLDPEVEERAAGRLRVIAEAHQSRVELGGVERLRARLVRAPLQPDRLYLTEEEWRAALRSRPLASFAEGGDGIGVTIPRFHEEDAPIDAAAAFIVERIGDGDRVVLATPSEALRRRLTAALQRRIESRIAAVESFAAALESPPGTIATALLPISEGFAVPGLTLIGAAESLGRRAEPLQTRRQSTDRQLDTLPDLRPGDVVVHIDHGTAVLRGLALLETDEAPKECLSLEYADKASLLVPAEDVNKVWRYGSEEAEVTLDRLKTDSWSKRRVGVEQQIANSARALLAEAARRADAAAPVLKAPKALYDRFVGRFPFTETEDQRRAIEATLVDLAAGRPMDRLVCGDVGFGKTEVALRATAVAAFAGKQVAIVAPTTVLVRQHLQTFRTRFAGFDLRVEQLSRLNAGKAATAVKEGLASGEIHIVVGTHALASETVRFSDLGLVVIDEEQRFGTREKNKMRGLRDGVHVLTLTATPIPRTLQSALVGIQDVSLIATPPVRRQPVRSFLLQFDPVVVKQALLRECRRGGQTFFVCPRIEDLPPMQEALRALTPRLDVAVAHGKMKADALDEAMVGFAEGRHDVLLTTNIVESGLDIPNANTMMIWHADRFGLAQLHQLRGRVGRGRARGVCYMLVEDEAELAPATRTRLSTLESLDSLGAGFEISMRDLDLRGAGDLFGTDQAGHVKLVGLELYQHLLERAVRAGRGEPVEDWAPELKLGLGSLIPTDYVPEEEVRIALYRRAAEIRSRRQADDFAAEVEDRFGPPPDAVRDFLAGVAVRAQCFALGVAKIDAGPQAIALTFRDSAAAKDRLSVVLAEADGELRWAGERLIVDQPTDTREARIVAVTELLERVRRHEVTT